MTSLRRSLVALAAVLFLTPACVASRETDDDDGSHSSGSAASGGAGGAGPDTSCVLQKRELGKTYCADDAPDLWSCPPEEVLPAPCSLSALQSSYCCPAQPSPCVDFCTVFAAACPAGDHSFTSCRDACEEASLTYAACDPAPYFNCVANAAYVCLDGTAPRTSDCRAELEQVLSCRIQQEAPPPVVVERNPTDDSYCAELTYPSTRVLSLGYHAYNLPSSSYDVDGCESLGGFCDYYGGCDAMLCCGLP